MIDASQGDSVIMNISPWVSRATLDAIGEGKYFSERLSSLFVSQFCVAAFDYQLGALENGDNELSKAYNNMMSVFSVIDLRELSTVHSLVQ